MVVECFSRSVQRTWTSSLVRPVGGGGGSSSSWADRARGPAPGGSSPPVGFVVPAAECRARAAPWAAAAVAAAVAAAAHSAPVVAEVVGETPTAAAAQPAAEADPAWADRGSTASPLPQPGGCSLEEADTEDDWCQGPRRRRRRPGRGGVLRGRTADVAGAVERAERAADRWSSKQASTSPRSPPRWLRQRRRRPLTPPRTAAEAECTGKGRGYGASFSCWRRTQVPRARGLSEKHMCNTGRDMREIVDAPELEPQISDDSFDCIQWDSGDYGDYGCWQHVRCPYCNGRCCQLYDTPAAQHLGLDIPHCRAECACVKEDPRGHLVMRCGGSDYHAVDMTQLLCDVGVSAECLVEIAELPYLSEAATAAGDGSLTVFVCAPALGHPDPVSIEVDPGATLGGLAALAAETYGLQLVEQPPPAHSDSPGSRTPDGSVEWAEW
eukprot:TRINITY_DN7_c0_g1_i5.p1 TRINITY_DN7_c0_g1~~TRINITY_DN7_c0_g1_i5.p1  ORF type:complete len:439 (+),score=77.28 TRINITY_DN7_c0_g1_i5:92-1408(+)